MPWLELIIIFLCAFTLEVGWVASVRLVTNGSVMRLIVAAMGMQTISYCSTLILVSNHISMIAGVLGAGVGALFGIQAPVWFVGVAPKVHPPDGNT